MSKSDIRPNESGNARMRLRSVKSVFNAAHRSAAVKIAAWSLALGLASCSPATLNAQETVKPPKDKPAPTAVEKKVTYETIADLSELQPYVDAAKDKIVTIKPGETKQFGPYSVKIHTELSNESYTHYVITTDDGKYESITMTGSSQNITMLMLDLGSSHPYIKGKMLAFANNEEVRFMFFDEKANEYQKATVSLEEGGIRSGRVIVGYGVDSDGLFVLTLPKRLVPGDVIGQATFFNDGGVGPAWYQYAPDKPSGTLVASPETK